MKIVRIEMTPVAVPAREGAINSPGRGAPLDVSHGGTDSRSRPPDELVKWILRVHTDDGVVGVGESRGGVRPDAMRWIAGWLLGVDVAALNLRDLPIPPAREYGGFEVAIFDLVGKALGVPAYRLLGGAYRDRVHCSAWFGQRSPDDAGDWAARYQELGYDCLKFKGSLREDPVETCQAVRARCGPDFRVIIDPQCGWERPSEVHRFLRRLEAVGNVWTLANPIPQWDLRNWRKLRDKSLIPLSLTTTVWRDDSTQKPQDVILALQQGAVDSFGFSGPMSWVQKLGGIAEVAGTPFWHSGELDLGILEASYLHVAAACKACTLPSDIFGRLIREHDLLTTPLEYDGASHFAVPQGPGLGIELDEDAVAQYAVGDAVEIAGASVAASA